MKLKPYFVDKVWGGDYFKRTYQYDTSDHCGELWGISGFEDKKSTITNGEFKGMSLCDLYHQKPALFGHYLTKDFPILVKMIEAKQNLSIQVHPDDDYAYKHHSCFGKTESWTIIDAKEDASIIIGHNAHSIQELVEAVEHKKYDTLLRKIRIKNGDTFDIYPGTIHAICKGTVLLEVQQASDITYRLYDYDRLENGQLRELHIDDALNIINVPSNTITHNGNSDYYTYDIFFIKDETIIAHKYGDYLFIVDGFGQIDNLDIKAGDFLFVPSENTYHITGNISVARIHIK
jgi:mannose-6-phosphate isomerase